ncbi:hypothetical protein [Streptomyces griseiscabiei]|uniref:Uncharacterized protein n=1 Tax=Streptomyces griseiscabiei TaxID=2993540 RepID=A0ABU4KYT0_9ACTN|nr:hypothetical protein [Streptomyces griseiscabiei]MBZ3904501.1 hypothetical protein [Streptomyces griseiscabiei]MDX2908250.1 hypothetical protein [Streptomyces griseiscabiei]
MNESGGYDGLLALLAGPADFWDRPTGDWPARNSGAEDIQHDVREARQDANAAYLLGTNALRRNELDSAEAWFAVACDQQHPGAAFRAALTRLLSTLRPKIVLRGLGGSGKSRAGAARMPAQMESDETRTVLRPAGSGKGRVIVLLTAAAKWGHGDAQRLISRLRSGPGEHAAGFPQPTGELATVVDDNDLVGLVLMADTVPWEPQDTEFYPTMQVLLEQCFAPRPPAPPALLEQPVGAEHQTLTVRRLLDTDDGQEAYGSGELFAERWPSRWRSLTSDGLGDISLRGRPGSHTRRWASGLPDDDEAQLFLFPIVLWPRSCCEASTPWGRPVSQRRCSHCSNEPPFTAALIEALGTDQQSSSTSLPRLFETVRQTFRTQEPAQLPAGVGHGSYMARLLDDLPCLPTETRMAVCSQHSVSSPGNIPGFTHRTFQEYLHSSMESLPCTEDGGFVARRARGHKLHERAREHPAADRALILATAMCDGVDIRHAEQLANSMLVSIEGLATGFDLPRPSHLHVVCDKTQRLYFFADPHGGSGESEEPRLAVPTAVAIPPGDSEEATQPRATTPSPSSDRSDLGELNRADPLQVYALDA